MADADHVDAEAGAGFRGALAEQTEPTSPAAPERSFGRDSSGPAIGRYVIIDELGRGGMAVVYRAHDPQLDREVAIKVLHPQLGSEPDSISRFEREARSVAALHHPHVLEVYDVGRAPHFRLGVEVSFIVMELAHGPTLREFVRRRGRLMPHVAAMVIRTLAEALHAAHQRGLVHRDIKPDNVMITEGGRLVLTDFGLARQLVGERVTQTGTVLGSPAYMSPEQARGAPEVDERSDLFALGIVFYELLTGKLPFSASNPLATILRIVEGRYEPPGRLNPQIGRDFEQLLARLLQRERDKRPRTAAEVIEALDLTLATVGISAEELPQFFAAPGDYNSALVPRIVQASLREAEQALSESATARALMHCDRALAFAPHDTQALALLARLSRPGPVRVVCRTLVVAVAAGAIVAALALFYGRIDESEQPVWRAQRSDARIGRLRAADAERSFDPVRQRIATMASDAGHVGQRDQRLFRSDGSKRPAAVAGGPRGSRRWLHGRARRKSEAWRGAAQRRTSRDAGAPAARADATVTAVRDIRVMARTSQLAQLSVRIGPWCNLTLDGKPFGRSPLAKPLRLAPGRYDVRCTNSAAGIDFRRQLVLRGGQHEKIALKKRVRVALELKRGDSVRVRGTTYTRNFWLPLGSHRVDLLRDGQLVEGTWLVVTRPCLLRDTPRLVCR